MSGSGNIASLVLAVADPKTIWRMREESLPNSRQQKKINNWTNIPSVVHWKVKREKQNDRKHGCLCCTEWVRHEYEHNRGCLQNTTLCHYIAVRARVYMKAHITHAHLSHIAHALHFGLFCICFLSILLPCVVVVVVVAFCRCLVNCSNAAWHAVAAYIYNR